MIVNCLKKTITMMVVLVMLFSFSGCNFSNNKKQLSKEEAGIYIQETLEERYGRKFEISELAPRRSSGPFNTMPGFVTVANEVNSDSSFRVEYGSKSGEVTDDYEKLVFGPELEQKTIDIIHNYEFITIDLLYGVYPLSAQNWLERGYDRYLQSSGVYVYARLLMDETIIPEEMADQIYALCEDFRDNSLFFSLVIYHGNQCAIISYKPGEEFPSKDYIYQELSRR